MHPILKKLNVKSQTELFVLNSPLTLAGLRDEWANDFTIADTIKADVKSVEFVLGFVQEIDFLNQIVPEIDNLLIEDGLFWIAFPKKSSKQFKSKINRDFGWECLGELGYEGVRLVAIDEDWSAMRFRKVKYIKSLKRDPKLAISKEAIDRMGKSNPNND